jgi:hypothetical protein
MKPAHPSEIVEGFHGQLVKYIYIGHALLKHVKHVVLNL